MLSIILRSLLWKILSGKFCVPSGTTRSCARNIGVWDYDSAITSGISRNRAMVFW
ncbi:hypothetical protein FOCG_17187 [Fusarium oxysporum f. sp. radicis-lycopersici 26381]|nr:hypothetical protein FOCG_17187 [Fusarium oxysporum f. sp. radicis-lycopersici 26381]